MFPTMRREPSKLPEERLAKLYEGDGFGGETTMRAEVIRELDAIRHLRAQSVDISDGARLRSDCTLDGQLPDLAERRPRRLGRSPLPPSTPSAGGSPSTN